MTKDFTKSIEHEIEPVEPRTEYTEAGNGISLSDSPPKLRHLWERRSFVVRFTGYGLILSLVIAFLIPRRFQSTTRLMPPDQSNSGLAMLAAASGGRGSGLSATGMGGSGLGSIADDLFGMKNTGDLFIGILQSRTVQDDVINKFSLRKVYWDRYMEDARKDLEERTEATADRKSGIITIHVTDRSPQRAMEMAQEYLTQLNRVVVLLNTSAAHREREFLEQRLERVTRDLELAENQFGDFASKNTALDIPAQGKAMIEASAALEGQLIGAQTELESLRQIYGDQNVRVLAAQARVEELRHQLEKIGGKFDSSNKPDDGAESMYPSIKQLPMLGVKYSDLYRNSKVQEVIFETLTQEYELAKVQEAKETPSVKVLDAPSLPEKKSFPPRMLIVALGTLLALSVAIFIVFAIAYWEDIDVRDPHKTLALEIFKTSSIWARGNGSSNGNGKYRFWDRFAAKDREFDKKP